MNESLSRGAWTFLGVVALLAAFAAARAPLATYALTLAAFGLVHVLTELRYVDRRFSPRLPFGLTATWLGLLALIVLLRLVRLTDVTPLPHAEAAELLLVAVLAITALIPLRRATWPRRATGVLVIALLLAGALLVPVTTLVVLAVLHNLTPIGFLAERLRGNGRRAWLAGATVLFGVVPVALAFGVLGPPAYGGAGPLPAGGLEDHLGVFVPAAWHARVDVAQLFAAAAYLQCMHYAVVIGLLPRLEPRAVETTRVYVRWPRARAWLPILGVAAVGGFVAYAASFGDARAIYGLFALVHAWVEIPVLMAALAPLPESA
ncbi:MAG: hypothetical protein QNJ90_09585 [Planctomycetota bacterium]|nr:hypothetical protein [Planctomycetota bacterium]